MSKWELEHTIWGKVILSIRNEILHNGGFESDTKLQKKFRSRFRVPFSMFEHLVVECTEANILDEPKLELNINYLVVSVFWAGVVMQTISVRFLA